jgi:protein-disulfide isomerase
MTMKTTLATGLKALILALGLAAPAVAQETAPETPTETVEIKDFSLGDPEAPVKITEYASFTCPHCAAFHANVFKSLKADYIDTDKVQFTYREVYFDRYGLWAAMVARCGGDMRYFGISDILFETQQEWAGSDDPNVVVENLKKIGRTAGMDDATLDACMKNGAMAEAMVARFEENMKADEVEGTPTLFINGVKHSNMEYADLKAIIEEELAK